MYGIGSSSWDVHSLQLVYRIQEIFMAKKKKKKGTCAYEKISVELYLSTSVEHSIHIEEFSGFWESFDW